MVMMLLMRVMMSGKVKLFREGVCVLLVMVFGLWIDCSVLFWNECVVLLVSLGLMLMIW